MVTAFTSNLLIGFSTDLSNIALLFNLTCCFFWGGGLPFFLVAFAILYCVWNMVLRIMFVWIYYSMVFLNFNPSFKYSFSFLELNLYFSFNAEITNKFFVFTKRKIIIFWFLIDIQTMFLLRLTLSGAKG